VKQIKELDGISAKERRAIFRKNRWNIFNHWQGWVGRLLFSFSLVLIILSRYWFPKEVSLLNRILILVAIGIIAFVIRHVCDLSVIAPYIREDIELMHNKNLIEPDDGNISEQGH
jgi:MFS superfamily sulfate permease-like transporter